MLDFHPNTFDLCSAAAIAAATGHNLVGNDDARSSVRVLSFSQRTVDSACPLLWGVPGSDQVP